MLSIQGVQPGQPADPENDDTGSRASSHASSRVFAYWYPSWQTWKFRRTLSYWISMMCGAHVDPPPRAGSSLLALRWFWSRAVNSVLVSRAGARCDEVRRSPHAPRYLEGSINFIVGAAFSMSSLSETPVFEKALVAGPYFVGGIAFTLGSYAGILEVINVPNKDNDGVTSYCFTGRAQWRRIREFLSWEPMLGYLAYFVGAM
jgi:hypothetical protein